MRNRIKLLIVVAAILMAVALFGQRRGGNTLNLRIQNDPRPVAKAAEMLESRFGWVVTYEDPRWTVADAKDVTTLVRKDLDEYKRYPNMQAPRVLIPKGGSLGISVAAADRSRPLSPMSVLDDLLNQHVAAGNPGLFRVQATNGRYHILPVSYTGRDGRTVSQKSVLDAEINLPSRESSALDVIDALCAAVATATGRQVFPGAMPLVTFGRHHGTYEARQETARDVLSRILDEIGPGYSWQLLDDPGDDLMFLNIHWLGNLKQEAQ